MTTNQVMNFWLMQAEQKRRLIQETKKVIIPSIYKSQPKKWNEEMDAFFDRLASTDYTI
jgi:hypothetical protein